MQMWAQDFWRQTRLQGHVYGSMPITYPYIREQGITIQFVAPSSDITSNQIRWTQGSRSCILNVVGRLVVLYTLYGIVYIFRIYELKQFQSYISQSIKNWIWIQSTSRGLRDKKWLNVLTYVARKSILLKWICNKPPTVSEWHKVIFKLLRMKYLTYWSRGKIGIFSHIWTLFLNYVGPRISNIFWKVLPRLRKDG